MKYKLIIFDADETLFDFKKSERFALENTMRELGMDYKEEQHLEIYKKINEGVWKDLEKGLITQQELNLIRFQRLLEHICSDCSAHSFAAAYVRHLACASFLYEESPAVIRSLSEKYRLAILSNGLKDVQNGRLRKSYLAEHFEEIIISEEVGLAKPDPAIFQLLLDRMKHAEKSSVLMVGDSLSSDIMGGTAFGIDTCWYNPSGMPIPDGQQPAGQQPTYEIRGLTDLLTFL